MLEVTYVCNQCGSTKTIKKNPQQTNGEFWNDLPSDIPCGVRDCQGRSYIDPTQNKREW